MRIIRYYAYILYPVFPSRMRYVARLRQQSDSRVVNYLNSYDARAIIRVYCSTSFFRAGSRFAGPARIFIGVRAWYNIIDTWADGIPRLRCDYNIPRYYYAANTYFGEVFSSMTTAGCTVYVLTGNSFLRFLWLADRPAAGSWPFETLPPDDDQLSVTLSTDSEWCRWGADTLALCAISCVVIRCPPLDTVLRSLLDPCHLRVSLDEPELALESLPWVAVQTAAAAAAAVVHFSESLPTTTTDSFSLLNLRSAQKTRQR